MLILRRERAGIKRDFLVEYFKKVPKNAFFFKVLACFFKLLPVAQKFWANQCLFSALGELGESIWSTLKKGRQKFLQKGRFINFFFFSLDSYCI